MVKKLGLRVLKIAITIGLITYVLSKAGLFEAEGWNNFLNTVALVDPVLLTASITIGLIISLASALKWYMLLQSRNFRIGLWRVYAFYIIGMFFNLILPTSLGGDVVRVHQLKQHSGRGADALASVFVERFTGMATLVLLAACGIVVNLKKFNLPWLTVGLGLGVAGISTIIWLIIDERPVQLIRKVIGKKLPILAGFFAKIDKFHQAVLAYKDDPKALVWALINSLIFYALAIVNVWVSVLAFGAELNLIDMVVAVPVILLIMNLPISIGGIGLMEFSYSFTLSLFGISPSVAISTALLMRLKSIIYAIIGGICYAGIDNRQEITPSAIKQSENN